MPNRIRIPFLLLLTALAFPLAPASNLSASEAGKAPALATGQSQDLAAFLNSLAQPALPGQESLIPAPENKVIYCSFSGCPSGQRCLNCNGNWVCIYTYPDDPDRVPAGCTGGKV
jgi:hypothetical protein